MSMQKMKRVRELENEIVLLKGSIVSTKQYIEKLLHRYTSPDVTIEKHLEVLKHCRLKVFNYEIELKSLSTQ